MRSFKHFFSLLSAVFLIAPSLRAQWVRLTGFQTAFGAAGSCNTQQFTPDMIRPVADGRILYTSLCKSASTHYPPEGYFMLSEDDLGTATKKWNIYQTWTFNSLGADEFSYGEYIQGKSSPYYISSTGVKPLNGSSGVIMATAITPKYVYVVYTLNPTYIDRHAKTGPGTPATVTLLSSAPVSGMHSYNEKLNFINDSIGFNLVTYTVNTKKTALVKISNFGATWQPLLIDSVDAIVDYQAFASGSIFVLKKSGAVHKSTNGGASFSQLTPAPQGTYTCIRFGDSNTGLIGGENGSLLRTQDGGNSWMNDNSTTTKRINAIYSFESSSYFVTDSNRVYRSAKPLSVSEAVYKNKALSIFPNPAKGALTINYPATNEVIIEISDLAGRVVTRSVVEQALQVDVSAYAAGVYMVRVRDNKRVLAVKKLIVAE